ncbi:OmpA/MotB family protein [Paenibacillus spongiae]|uniref:Flagellar motor protein MotB n=1 Tax=Paenibacillus spongiae TaxID=2909671 RepID=A0ABY5S871_9BACL|nr:flagellar motor protein MotB [Paenibacillus spongiae]UVI29864.1 flagellar motor protein MotB [Paenibacillus spongiae]
MRRSRRRSSRRDAPESHDRWLITYADLITLLMIFFVILYAMSQLDVKKYEVLAQSLNFEFRKAESPLEGGSGLTGSLDKAQQPKPPETSEKVTDPEEERRKAEKLQLENELQDLLRIIQTYIKDNRLENLVYVADTSKGIAIRLSDQFLFDLGKADLKTYAKPVLDKLASLFKQLKDNTISIEGHTDNLPIQEGGAFRDNWELSAARSLSVLRYFVDGAKIDPKKFEIAGYGDTRPVAPNTTEANRQKNRRVEITVMRIIE